MHRVAAWRRCEGDMRLPYARINHRCQNACLATDVTTGIGACQKVGQRRCWTCGYTSLTLSVDLSLNLRPSLNSSVSPRQRDSKYARVQELRRYSCSAVLMGT